MADWLIKWEPVCQRIPWAEFRLDNVDLKGVVVYCPVEGSVGEGAERFVEELDGTIKPPRGKM